MTVPDEAVEAAAKALAIVAWGEWEYVPTALRGRMRRDARITLEAAAPFIAAQAWDEGWNAFARYDSDQRQSYPDNPYRSAT